jgi:hypothetical protein
MFPNAAWKYACALPVFEPAAKCYRGIVPEEQGGFEIGLGREPVSYPLIVINGRTSATGRAMPASVRV